MNADKKIKLLALQQEALKLYLSHFYAFIPHLRIKKKDKLKIHKIFETIIKEKKEFLNTLKQIERK